ncbi:MAG: nucleotidyltransferase [Ruminococcaceae bacterium]|nr:nucleotidyltransferase [Oscillospiraceae bacterium]
MESNKITLAVMAAGMGSRFGGLKQIEPVGPDGEIIIDYSVYDAKQAGFDKVVFIIKKEIAKDFREVMGKRIEKMIDVDYAFQELDKLPAGFSVPDGRTKPWGTGHAILCAKDLIDTPFAVINADDYYGSYAYQTMAEHLKAGTADYSMVGFLLKNTLTENGTVARGVCEAENGYLKTITERTKIQDSKYTEDGENWIQLPEDTIVSMNLWGFDTSIFTYLEQGFDAFCKTRLTEEKSEFFLPSVVDGLIQSGEKKVRVLSTPEKWYGVTYREDKEMVKRAMAQFVAEGKYKGI